MMKKLNVETDVYNMMDVEFELLGVKWKFTYKGNVRPSDEQLIERVKKEILDVSQYEYTDDIAVYVASEDHEGCLDKHTTLNLTEDFINYLSQFKRASEHTKEIVSYLIDKELGV